MSILPKIIIILGPTASGKSDIAIRLAKKFDGEIISADSRQVYRGMNIGSGKVSGKWNQKLGVFISENIPHHLIDIADPNDDFNVSHFKKMAEKAIAEILQRGQVPILCGGTGFWIQAVVDNVVLPEVKPNPELRSMLRSKTAAELFAELQKLDSRRAETIDPKNKVRLIRALEICAALGAVPKTKARNTRNDKYDFLEIGIDTIREELNEKIKRRLDERFEEGMIKEVENLQNPSADGGVAWERLEYFGLEYRWIARYLQNKIPLAEMKEKLYFDIIHYAKRQMTWFKQDERILWLKDYAEIEKSVAQFLK